MNDSKVTKQFTSKEFVSDSDSSSPEDDDDDPEDVRNSEDVGNSDAESTSSEENVENSEDVEIVETSAFRRDDSETRLQRKLREEKRRNYTRNDRFYVLKCLYESVSLQYGGFNLKSFDWNEFAMRCAEAEVTVIPNSRTALQKYKTQYFSSQRNIFQHLEPEPTLTDKLTFIYEALVRYSVLNRKHRLKEHLVLRPSLLFTVVYEHYTAQNATWQPPEPLQKYRKMVNVKKIENRVETVMVEKERRKRDTESPKFSIRTKRIKRETSEGRARSVLGVRMEFDISAIPHSTSMTSIPPEDVTYLELSELTENSHQPSSSSFAFDETILAGGGGGPFSEDVTSSEVPNSGLMVSEFKSDHNPMDSLILPKIDKKVVEKRKNEEKKPFELAQDGDIWSQIVNF